MSDEAEEIFALRDEFDRQRQVFQAAAQRDLVDSASDDSGEITIVLPRQDADLEIRIGGKWKDHYAPSDLAQGILQTYAKLAAARMAAWAEGVSEEQALEHRATPIDPSSDATATATAIREGIDGREMTTENVTSMMERTLSLLEEMDRGFAETFDIASNRVRGVQAGETFSGFATVEITGGGDLADVSFSQRWLAGASGQSVTAELRNAIQAARQEANNAPAVTNPLAGTPLEKLHGLVADPEAFTNYLLGEG